MQQASSHIAGLGVYVTLTFVCFYFVVTVLMLGTLIPSLDLAGLTSVPTVYLTLTSVAGGTPWKQKAG